MKILVSKDFGEDKPSNDIINQFMEATTSDFNKITLFFDRGSHNSDGQHPNGNFSFIGLDFEERNEALSIAIKTAVQQKCEAIIFFNRESFPKEDIVNKLAAPMEDQNIFATVCDYTIDDTLMIQNRPVVICRRIEDSEDLYDLSKCQGIVKYIPLDLYNVKTN
jgi:hypothetical protein